MPSNIEFITIDEAFPVAGKNNSSQGFRDNFDIIKNGLKTASEEITELQEFSVRRDVDSDLLNNSLINANLDTFTKKSLDKSGGTKLTTTAQNPVDIKEGHYQSYVVGGNVNFAFKNWPAENYASIIVELRTDDGGPYTVSFANDGGGGIKKEPSVIWDEALAETGPFKLNTLSAVIGQTEVLEGPEGEPDYKRQIFQFWTYDGGLTIYAKYLGGYDSTSEAPVTSGGTGTGDVDCTLDINNQTGTQYTLVLADAGDFVRMDNALSNQLVVPSNNAVPFEQGTIVLVRQVGEGKTTIVPSIGVTVNAPLSNFEISETDFGVALVKVGVNTWDMIKAFGGVAESDLAAFTQEFEARLQDFYVEILSADPTFIVRFDAIQDSVDNAVTQLQNEFNILETGTTQAVTDLSNEWSTLQSTYNQLDPRITTVENEFADIRLEFGTLAEIQTEIDTTLAELQNLGLSGSFANQLTTNGYQKMPGGFIMQWGTVEVDAQFAKAINWPVAFPTAVLNAQATIQESGATDYTRTDVGATIGSLTSTGAIIINFVSPTTAPNKTISWFAVGY